MIIIYLKKFFLRMSALPIFRAVAVKNSQKFGFTNRAIGAAAKSLDLSPASEAILTPSRLAMEVCKERLL